MSLRIETLPPEDAAWDEFSAEHPDAGPFHLPAWSRLLGDVYGFQPFVLAARDTDGELVAGVPAMTVRSPLGQKRWVSLPFSDSCELLVRPDADVSGFAEALRTYTERSDVADCELRTTLPDGEGIYPVDVGYLHLLELPDGEAHLRPNKGHRNSRNQAIRKGVTVTHGTSPEELATFFELHTLTRRRHGVPVQPRRFFELLRERLLCDGHGFVATASIEGVAQAAAIYLEHNGVITAKYHASDPRLRNTGAGYLIDWETMVHGCRVGHHTLDMGRSDLDADGLRLYKKSWGATEVPLVYTHISKRPPSDMSRLELTDLAKRVIRQSPPWVCVTLGQLFYRWAA